MSFSSIKKINSLTSKWMWNIYLKDTLLFLIIVGGKGGSNKMHHEGNLSRFLKMGGLFLGHSLIIIKWNWGVFSIKFAT